ncbi:MAG: hypothetical protein U0326_20040 [Polyangiales bacterium]
MTRRPRRAVTAAIVGVGAALILLPSLAPATIEEQRTRLPPPATCQDPIEGIWMSHKYEVPGDEWMIFTLEIHRAPGSVVNGPPGTVIPLIGHIQAHAWLGAGSQASAPPPCSSSISHWTVEMTAEGRVVDQRVDFWGTRWAVGNVFCGPRNFGYNLDHFSGVIDPTIQEFQSVNNDGGRAVNDPTVFRRVRCFDPVAPPHPFVAPPTFQPPHRSGCSR